jgi:hypothetical protein
MITYPHMLLLGFPKGSMPFAVRWNMPVLFPSKNRKELLHHHTSKLLYSISLYEKGNKGKEIEP